MSLQHIFFRTCLARIVHTVTLKKPVMFVETPFILNHVPQQHNTCFLFPGHHMNLSKIVRHGSNFPKNSNSVTIPFKLELFDQCWLSNPWNTCNLVIWDIHVSFHTWGDLLEPKMAAVDGWLYRMWQQHTSSLDVPLEVRIQMVSKWVIHGYNL